MDRDKCNSPDPEGFACRPARILHRFAKLDRSHDGGRESVKFLRQGEPRHPAGPVSTRLKAGPGALASHFTGRRARSRSMILQPAVG